MARRPRKPRERETRHAPVGPAALPAPTRRPAAAWLVPLGLVLLVFVVFWPVHGFGFINFDDPHYVYDNPHVTTGLTLANLKWAFTTGSPYFHPVTWVSLMVDAQVFGAWAGGHHLMAVGLHALSSVLLFLFLYRTTGAIWRSAFVAAIFAVHPMRVESVAWAAERKDLLAALAMMLTLNAYVSYVRRPSLPRYLLATLPFALGLFAKPILVTLPFALLLVDVWPLARVEATWSAIQRSARALIVEKLPWIGLALIAVYLNVTIQVQPITTFENLPLAQRLANVVMHYAEYIGMMAWPAWLSPLHPVAQTMPPWWMLAGAMALLAGLSIWALRALSARPYVTVGWFWFLATLVPVIGFVQAGDTGICDRFGYMTQFFLYAALAWGASDWLRSASARQALAAVALLIIGGSAVWTRGYLENWRDSVSLWRYAVRVGPDNHRAHANLADALASAGRLPEADAEFREAIRLAPGFPFYHYYYGEMLAQNGRLSDAIAEYNATLKLTPNDARTHDALGLALTRGGRVDEALAHLREAIRLDPALASARANLGLALARTGDGAGALAAYDESLRLDPNRAQTHSNRAALLLAMNRVDDAVAEFSEAQRLEPSSAERWVNLGTALSRQGKPADAAAAFERALTLDARNVEALNGRGVLLSEQGKTADAIAMFTRALEINPRLLHVYSNRGRAFAVAGDVDAAIRDFQQILRLDPGNGAAAAAIELLKKAKGGK